MGLFDRISSAIKEGKERVTQETADFADRIKYANMKDACIMTVRKLDGASLPMKGSLSKLIQTRIQSTDNNNELFDAFDFMYNYARDKRNTYALNISQWLGKRLDDLGDSRVEKRQRDDGRYIYIPDNYHRNY